MILGPYKRARRVLSSPCHLACPPIGSTDTELAAYLVLCSLLLVATSFSTSLELYLPIRLSSWQHCQRRAFHSHTICVRHPPTDFSPSALYPEITIINHPQGSESCLVFAPHQQNGQKSDLSTQTTSSPAAPVLLPGQRLHICPRPLRPIEKSIHHLYPFIYRTLLSLTCTAPTIHHLTQGAGDLAV